MIVLATEGATLTTFVADADGFGSLGSGAPMLLAVELAARICLTTRVFLALALEWIVESTTNLQNICGPHNNLWI